MTLTMTLTLELVFTYVCTYLVHAVEVEEEVEVEMVVVVVLVSGDLMGPLLFYFLKKKLQCSSSTLLHSSDHFPRDCLVSVGLSGSGRRYIFVYFSAGRINQIRFYFSSFVGFFHRLST